MSRFKVKTPFRDKDTNDLFGVGSEYYTEDQERAKYLQEWGYLGEVIETETESDPDNDEEGIKHVGGGYYELPNGEKVKGKDKALEALKVLQDSDE